MGLQHENMTQIPLANDDESSINLKTSPIRFYILIIFSAFNCLQSLIWNMFSPLENVLTNKTNEKFNDLDITPADIYLFPNWGCITMILILPFFSYLLNKKMIREAIMINGVLCFFVAVVRIVP